MILRIVLPLSSCCSLKGRCRLLSCCLAESCVCRSLDEYEPPEPKDDVEKTIREVEELRPKLTHEQNLALDRKIWEQLFKNPALRVKDKDGREVSSPFPLAKLQYALSLLCKLHQINLSPVICFILYWERTALGSLEGCIKHSCTSESLTRNGLVFRV